MPRVCDLHLSWLCGGPQTWRKHAYGCICHRCSSSQTRFTPSLSHLALSLIPGDSCAWVICQFTHPLHRTASSHLCCRHSSNKSDEMRGVGDRGTGGGWRGLIRGRIREGREEQTDQPSSVFREISFFLMFFLLWHFSQILRNWDQRENVFLELWGLCLFEVRRVR